jgi:hypothetical protein
MHRMLLDDVEDILSDILRPIDRWGGVGWECLWRMNERHPTDVLQYNFCTALRSSL